ncbi:MAG: class I SAM-dependent methyltransferase [Burkholderiaceae bacterium]|nr:class I SAM-dependent methyltransferase [Burkholderiaceae bacterium]
MEKSNLRTKLRAIPVVGYALTWLHALAVLPLTRRTQGISIELLQQEITEVRLVKERLQAELSTMKQIVMETLKPRLENIEELGLSERLERYDVLNIGERLARYDDLQIMERLEDLKSLNIGERLAYYDMLNIGERLERYDMLEIGKRLMQLDELQLPRQIKSVQQMIRDQPEWNRQLSDKLNNQHKEIELNQIGEVRIPKLTNLDDFYLEFEALFRGGKDDIKERLRVYLPYLSYIQRQKNLIRANVVDVGCGRGEWLELLDENDIPAMGVDLNASMVDSCICAGLFAKCGDAIRILQEMPAGSVGAVTAFHLIEHLPFERLIALFDAAKEALCEGGVIIFETPNPENLKVGACNFYMDPTHLNPVVPQVAEFIAKQRGFKSAEILRLHPYPQHFLMQGSSDVANVINKEFFGPQDYALIAVK